MQTMYMDLRRQVFDAGCRVSSCPRCARPRWRPTTIQQSDTYRVNDQDVPGRGWIATTPFNSRSLPGGQCADRSGQQDTGVPTGLQIVADAYEDLDAFQVAAAYASVAPRFFAGDLLPDYREQA